MISVMIVDDEKLVRSTLRDYIDWENLGVDIIYEAEDGAHALTLMEEQAPSIVISDIKMPHMDGMEFARLAREKYPDSRFVFLSGYSDKEYLKGAIHLHVDGYIEKPLNLQEISQLMSQLIDVYKQEFSKKSPRVYFYRGDACGAVLGKEVFTLSKTSLSELGQKLRAKDPSAGIRMLRELCRRIRQCEGTSVEYVRNVYSQFALQIESAAEFLGARKTEAASEQFIYSSASATSLADLEQELFRITELLATEISAQDFDPIMLTNTYLQNHYEDSSITVEEIAQSLNFNTSYLCSIYKQRTGKTINAALTSLRIEIACGLLKNTALKLYEVGSRVGYTNGKYFTRVFTKETGVTPREYRERHYG